MPKDELSRISASCPVDNGLALDFLQFLFPRDKETGHYQVSSTNIVGEALTYMALPALLPAEIQPGEDQTVCTFDLPQVRALDDCRSKWLQYPATAVPRINHLLQGYFELDFYRFYLKGLQYGYEKQEIVENYVLSRNLTTGEPFDTLHKRVYRQEIALMKKKASLLLRKAKYFFDEQDTSLLDSRK